MPKVSVIIPVYGVEKYIEQCVRSLFAQTLDDVEYIFINDCTPDRSIELLQSVLVEYPQRKEQVYIFHNEKNIGQVGTRKRGVSVAKGDYVIHCDSDDWVEENWLEILYKKAILTHAEIVWCDFTSCHEDGKRVYNANEASPTIEDFFFKLIIGIKWGTLWSHLVKREIVQSQQIVWPTWNYCEDLALVFQYITLISNVAYIKESLYNYRYNLESISGKRDKVNVLKNIQGEINASLVGIACSKKMGLSKRFAPYFCTRILKAKGRIFGIAKNDWETCKLWNSFNDGITICDVWTSSLLLREKISLSFVRLYIYPLKKIICHKE